jgi:hypothetical protein
MRRCRERYVGGAADTDDRLRQTAVVRISDPRIDARDPAGGAFGDVGAPPGPTVLPEPPSRPVSSRVEVGGAALAVEDVIIAITAATRTSSLRGFVADGRDSDLIRRRLSRRPVSSA